MLTMPLVNECTAEQCAYNREHACHALAITVGEPQAAAQCDTFFDTAVKGGDQSTTGRVGACKMADCAHNVDLECQAPGIQVGQHAATVDCLTYQPNGHR